MSEIKKVIIEDETGVRVILVGVQGPPGPSGLVGVIIGEPPVKLSGATYETAYDFIPETVEVKVNGLTQKKIDDYQTSGTRQIILSDILTPGESILVNYIRG